MVQLLFFVVSEFTLASFSFWLWKRVMWFICTVHLRFTLLIQSAHLIFISGQLGLRHICSNEVVWIPRKRLILLGFGVKYVRHSSTGFRYFSPPASHITNGIRRILPLSLSKGRSILLSLQTLKQISCSVSSEVAPCGVKTLTAAAMELITPPLLLNTPLAVAAAVRLSSSFSSSLQEWL